MRWRLVLPLLAALIVGACAGRTIAYEGPPATPQPLAVEGATAALVFGQGATSPAFRPLIGPALVCPSFGVTWLRVDPGAGSETLRLTSNATGCPGGPEGLVRFSVLRVPPGIYALEQIERWVGRTQYITIMGEKTPTGARSIAIVRVTAGDVLYVGDWLVSVDGQPRIVGLRRDDVAARAAATRDAGEAAGQRLRFQDPFGPGVPRLPPGWQPPTAPGA